MSGYSPRRISDHSESDEENLSIEWIDQLREFYQQRDDDDDDFDNDDDDNDDDVVVDVEGHHSLEI